MRAMRGQVRSGQDRSERAAARARAAPWRGCGRREAGGAHGEGAFQASAPWTRRAGRALHLPAHGRRASSPPAHQAPSAMDTTASSSSRSGDAAAHAAFARVHHLPGHPLPFLASGGPLCCSGADEGGRVDLFARSLRRPLLLFLPPHVQATGDCAAAQHLRAVAAARPAWLRAEPQLEVRRNSAGLPFGRSRPARSSASARRPSSHCAPPPPRCACRTRCSATPRSAPLSRRSGCRAMQRVSWAA